MWGAVERSPVLAAPSFNDHVGLTATSTNLIVGQEDEDPQAPNNLCEKYKPLALKIASGYRDRGIHFEELRSAAYLGLVSASRKFDPERGAFGPYARHWIKGEITALFKSNDPLASGYSESLTVWHDDDDSGHQTDVAAPAPTIAPDLGALSDRERHIIEARARAETLTEIGKELGISAERVRQLEARALPKIKGGVASACISDLTKRGIPIEPTRRYVEFRDREPPKHIYREPPPSRRLAHHRAIAPRLAALRGNKPFRRWKGPYGGAIVISWGRP
jgi:RNA polymerase sigma factor (sigma-70 family)